MATSLTTDEDESCKFYAIALYDYEPLENDQLVLTGGNLLAVVNDDNLESTGWLGSLNLDTGAAGWVSKDYLHALDSASHADAYVQSRSAPMSGDGIANETLGSLIGKVVNVKLGDEADDSSSLMHDLPSIDVETSSIATMDADNRSMLSIGGVSVSSMATYGSAYPASSVAAGGALKSSDLTAGFGGVDAFLRHQRLYRDGSIYGTDSGSNSGSGSSGSTIKSSYPATSLRTASSTSGFSFAGSTLSQENGSSSLVSAGLDASSRDLADSLTDPPHWVHHAPSQSLSASVSTRGPAHNWSPSVSSSSTTRSPRQERPGLIIPPTPRVNALRDAGASPGSLQAPFTIPTTTSPTRSISMTSGRKILSSDELNLYERGEPIPWYLEPSYQPHELQFNAESAVEAGTLEALVEWLTTPRNRVKPVEIEFRDAFLSTYRSFTDANTLMNLLAGRYEMAEPLNLGPDEFETWKHHKLRPVQMQVLTVLKSWMQDHHMLDAEPEEVPRIREFLTYIKTPEKHEKVAKFMLTMMEKELGANDNERLPSPLSPSSAASSSTSSLNSSARQQRKKGGASFRRRPTKFDPLKFDTADIAAQLTHMEHGMYAKISSNELIMIAKEKDRSGQDVRNLQRYSMFNRKLSKATKYIILTTDPVAKRREVLLHLIRVVEKCRALHNYAAVHFLMVGITSNCLDKLSFTWHEINKHQRLENLRALTRSADRYAAYRNALDSVGTGACIPVLGIYLPMLKHIDAKPDNISVESPYNETVDLINFAKRREMANVCRQALRFQGRIPSTEHVQENPDIQAWIEEQLEAAASHGEQWFTDKAADVQRREEDHSDIRKGLEAAGF